MNSVLYEFYDFVPCIQRDIDRSPLLQLTQASEDYQYSLLMWNA